MDTATIKRYAKFVVALAGAVAIAANEVVIADSGDLERPQGWITVAIAVATAIGVRQKANTP